MLWQHARLSGFLHGVSQYAVEFSGATAALYAMRRKVEIHSGATRAISATIPPGARIHLPTYAGASVRRYLFQRNEGGGVNALIHYG
jgi:hypothetical protein